MISNESASHIYFLLVPRSCFWFCSK